MTMTSTNNYDALVLQRSATPSSGVYTCSIQDFYISSGQPNVLKSDTLTSLDKTMTSTSSSSAFQLTIPRTLGNMNGEDWEGGEFVDICFFTSASAFSQSSWTKQYSACFGYQIAAYVSTFRGTYLGTMLFEGVNSKVYGGIYGPFLQLKLFWYRQSAAMTNTSNLIIRIGDEGTIGYDYFKCGVGDYYGSNHNAMLKDLDYSGYENGACTFTTTATAAYL